MQRSFRTRRFAGHYSQGVALGWYAMPRWGIAENTMPRWGIAENTMPRWGFAENTMPRWGFADNTMPRWGIAENGLSQRGINSLKNHTCHNPFPTSCCT